MRIARLALLGAGWLFSAPSSAEEPSPWLRWSAPPECQNSAEVERRVQFLLGRSVDFAVAPPTRVAMGWSAGRGWAVKVTVELAAGPRYRALDAPSCADAFDVIALSLALILDPDFEADEPLAPAERVEEAPDERPAELAAAPAEEPRQGFRAIEASAVALDASTGADAFRTGDMIPDGAVAPTPASIIVGAGALADPWTLPMPQFGAAVQAALELGRARIELEGDLLTSSRRRFSSSRYPVSFSSLIGGVRGCYAATVTARLGWLGCVGAELGSLRTREYGGEERRARGLWLAAQALTGPEFAMTEWLRAFARFRAVTPLRRHEFFLSEGSRVHELPWVSLQIQLGVALAVTELGGGEH